MTGKSGKLVVGQEEEAAGKTVRTPFQKAQQLGFHSLIREKTVSV